MNRSSIRRFATTAAGAAMWIVSLPLHAQQSPRTSTPPPEMIITGCLKAGPNPSGVPDTTTYTLEPVEAAPAPSHAGAQADAMKPKSGTRYTLTAASTAQFKPHVGHKVELTGHLKELSAPEPEAKTDPQAKPPQLGGAHNTFEVASLKMIAPACP